MREYLNNPKIVIPLTLVALFWGGYRYGLFDLLAHKFFNSPELTSNSLDQAYAPEESNEHSSIMIRNLMRDSWLTPNWVRESMVKNEPFVADYDFSRDAIAKTAVIEKPEEFEKPEEKVIVDKETFQATIASKLGLDRDGFFAVFQNTLNVPVRKRIGDKIYLKEGQVVYIPTFGIAESPRSAEEQRAKIVAVINKMELKGVSTGNPDADKKGSRVPGNSEHNSAFIQVAGETKVFYRQGDLVYRNPSLGLDQIYEGKDYDWVILVDAAQNQYELRTADKE